MQSIRSLELITEGLYPLTYIQLIFPPHCPLAPGNAILISGSIESSCLFSFFFFFFRFHT